MVHLLYIKKFRVIEICQHKHLQVNIFWLLVEDFVQIGGAMYRVHISCIYIYIYV